MKRLFLSTVGILAFILSTLSHAEEGKLLLNLTYSVRANVDYATDLYKVNDAPAAVNKIRILQVGTYCNIYLTSIEYNTTSGGVLRQATFLSNGTYQIDGGSLNAIRIHFVQRTWDRVTCGLEVYAASGGGTTPGEELLGVIQYQGGFADKLTLALNPAQRIKSFRVAIPSFCQNAEVLEAGSYSEGIYDRASGGSGTNVFLINGGAGERISGIAATLNGPLSLQCAIPIYGTR